MEVYEIRLKWYLGQAGIIGSEEAGRIANTGARKPVIPLAGEEAFAHRAHTHLLHKKCSLR